LKILHTESSGGWGGQEIRILTESQVFFDHGHEVIIAADKDSQIAKKAFEFGVKVRPIRLSKKRWGDFKALRSLIIKENPDVISCHSSTDHWLAALARLTIKNSPAIVRTRHISTAVHRNWPTKWLYSEGAEAIMTTGISIRSHLIEDHFVDSTKVFSIPTGIDLNRFAPGNQKQQRKKLGLPQNHFIFGIVATLRSWKGHADLIEAFDKLEQPEVSLIIVGDGPQMDACRAMASKTKYPQNIYFFGNQNDVVPYLQAIDSFVLPSYANEGVPQALLQAMAVGVPVITCAIGGIPESIKNYSNKTVVATRNPKLLSLSMKEAILQKSEGRVRRKRLTEHSLDSMYESVLKVYKSAIQQSICG
jgi:glycosyltransferase involved in cell wall biosynthesis